VVQTRSLLGYQIGSKRAIAVAQTGPGAGPSSPAAPPATKESVVSLRLD
jgi:hypothetical protein